MRNEAAEQGGHARLLLRAAERVLGTTEEAGVLAAALDLLGDEFSYRMRYVLRYVPATNELVMAAAAGPAADRPEVTAFRVPVGQGLTGACAMSRRVVNVPDVRSDPRYLAVVPECVSEICVPLEVGDELLGVISLHSPRVGAFSPTDEEILTAFGKIVAFGLVHARAIRARDAHIAELQALNDVARVASGLDTAHTLSAAAGVVRRATASDSTVIYLYDAATSSLNAAAASIDAEAYPPDYLERLRARNLAVGESMSGWAARELRPVKIDDLAHDPRPRPVTGVRPGPRSGIAVPLLAEGKLYGVLRATKLGVASYTDEQFALAQTIASQLAVAVSAAMAHDEVQRLAISDGLTGLFNARHFRLRLGEEVLRAARYRRELALIVLDSDSLKQVNDKLGHKAGDGVLECLARAIRANVRAVDIAARYGGDEFVLLLPETALEAALATAERVRVAAEGEVGGVALAVSLGVACFPVDADDPDALFNAADRALYQAKRTGKNRVVAARSLPH